MARAIGNLTFGMGPLNVAMGVKCKSFLPTFIDITDYAMRAYGQVADRYHWEKISQILISLILDISATYQQL